VRACCEKAWIAGVLDSEGTVNVWKQSSRNMKTRAFGMNICIFNNDKAFIEEVVRIFSVWGAAPSVSSRMTSKLSTRPVYEVHVRKLDDVVAILDNVVPYLIVKKEFGCAVLGLALARKVSRQLNGDRAPWTESEIRLAQAIRRQFMPYRKRANGEAHTGELRVIPCQAEGSTEGTSEGVEARDARSASSNRPHECPAPQRHLLVVGGEEMVRSSVRAESRDKKPCEDIAAD